MNYILQISEVSEASKEALSNISNNGLLGSLLVVAIISIILIIIYFSKREESLQNRINQVIDNHMSDLRENTKDVKDLTDKYHSFVNELKSLFYNQHK